MGDRSWVGLVPFFDTFDFRYEGDFVVPARYYDGIVGFLNDLLGY